MKKRNGTSIGKRLRKVVDLVRLVGMVQLSST